MFIDGLTIYIMALAASSLIFLARSFSPLKPLFSRSNLIGSKVTFSFLKDEFQANVITRLAHFSHVFRIYIV